MTFYFFQKSERLKWAMQHDQTTGLLNRVGLQRRVHKACRVSSVLIIDIDKFKSINDTYGHPLGDEVIKEVASVIRETDSIAARWGGEEFVIYLPDTDYEDALRVAERLRKTIETRWFSNKKIQITISVGGTSANEMRHGDLERLIEIADGALYDAKKERNSVVFH